MDFDFRLCTGAIFAIFQSYGSLPMEKDSFKIVVREGASCVQHCFKTCGEISSGPGDLFTFNCFR